MHKEKDVYEEGVSREGCMCVCEEGGKTGVHVRGEWREEYVMEGICCKRAMREGKMGER